MKWAWFLTIVLAAGAAHAEPFRATTASCANLDTTPGALLDAPPPEGELETPIPWTEFVVDGTLIDPPSTVHALLAPTLDQHRTDLSPRMLRDVAKLIAKLGYQLTNHSLRGTQLVLELEPLPMVRKVDVDTHQSLFEHLLDEEIRRRMLLHTGAYLPLPPRPNAAPGEPDRQACAIFEEKTRLEDYLHGEGYFEAIVDIDIDKHMRAHVNVDLGAEFTIEPKGPKVVLPHGFVAVTEQEIKAIFRHKEECIVLICYGTARFTRSQHQEDLQRVRDLFHRRQYPAVRVQSSFDPTTSVMHGSKHVDVTITIDPRRRLQVDFQGVDLDENGAESLRQQLTFDQSGSTDDVEAAASAHALETFFQQHYRFDARVTWSRERTEDLDRVTFQIDQGPHREVRGIQFVCNGGDCAQGQKPFDSSALSGIVATKKWDYVSDLIGTQVAATSNEMAADQDRLREAYRRAGYRDMQVGVTVSPIPIGPPHSPPPEAALVAAMVETGEGEALYVRYTIDEGAPTLLSRVELEAVDEAAARALSSGLCKQLLAELGGELGVAPLAAADPKHCVAVIAGLPFREDDVALTKDRLRDFLFKQGRLRADIDYEARVLEPHRIEAHYLVRTIGERKLGKVVVRGNFRTRSSIIGQQLDFHEGQLLTSDVLADGARRLRTMGLFDAVNIDLVDLGAGEQTVNAAVHIEERYDNTAQIELQGGYSSYNHLFGTLIPSIQNVAGLGASITATLTYGEKIQDYEGKIRAPKWLFGSPSDYKPNIDLTGLYLQQDTPAFGLLTTEGATLGSTWLVPRQHTSNTPARAMAFGLNYSYRLRTRNIDALRPIGADMDQRQVAVATETGSIGGTVDIDQRVDRHGQLSPLAPESGYHVYGSVSYAFPQLATWVGGQYTFIKTSASGSYFLGLGDNLVVRGDLRYDQGFPLGGAALLPEVERFFAGGDNTVRGYNDDELATEIVQIGVPPLAGVSQIRVFPAGGDIRVMSSVDAQYRIWKIIAGAVFTDAGMIANDWRLVTVNDIRPSVGMGVRFLTPFGIGAIEYAVPIEAHLGDDPRGRIHFYFAARAQF